MQSTETLYTLYSATRTAGMAPQMILEEIGAPYRLVEIPLDTPRSAEYLAVNPTGKVPALRVEGVGTLFESAAISMFLADRHPEVKLAPRPGEHDRALYYQWMMYLASTVEPVYFLYHYPQRHTTNLDHAAELRERAIQRFPEVWQVVDDALARRGPYLLGERFSACDIVAFMLAEWTGPAGDLLDRLPHLARCVELVGQRPAIQRTMRRHQRAGAVPTSEPAPASASAEPDLATPEAVLAFWFDRAHEALWFDSTPEFDEAIRRRFEATMLAALDGRLAHWQQSATGAVALVVMLDQFTRNLYRGTERAYVGDGLALEAAERALAAGFDRGLSGPMRMFFYMPFHHSETLAHQERSVALFRQLRDEARDMSPEELSEQLEYAERYREIIRRYGRFPHRNAILGRPSTADELALLQGTKS